VIHTPEFHGLASNPFYEKYDHALVGEARIAQLKRVADVIMKSADAKAPFVVTMSGTVGMGKSFTLMVLTKKFEAESFKSKCPILPVKIDAILGVSSGKYIQYVATSVFRELGRENFQLLIRKFGTEVARTRQDPQKTLSGIHSDFRNAFLKFETDEELVWALLTGEKADLRELKKLGIKNKIDSPAIALRTLQEFCRILKLTGYGGLLLCLDEAEELALAGARKLVEVLTMLKKILEQSKNQMSTFPSEAVPIIFCLGFTPETLNLITGAEFAEQEMRRTGGAGLSTFLRRMSVDARFRLEPFSDEDATEFIKVILNKARKKPLDSTSPFEENAVHHLNNISRGIPATIIEYSRVCLEVADEKEVATISGTDSQKWLQETGIISESGALETGGDEEVTEL
jgi:hypothetical protein